MIDRDSSSFKQAILAALADREMLKILDCVAFRSKSVGDVIRETGISHSTAYRKIKWMLEESLLFIERIEVTSEGKKFSLFRSTIKSVDVKYELGKMTVKVDHDDTNILERTAERFFSLGEPE
jgi:DNA-binding transcriptional ArsR family regulator